jgi:DNA repair protein RadA
VTKKKTISPVSSVVTDKMEAVNDVIGLKLEDMDGIGSVRLKKLYSNGIYTVDDLLGYGEESLSRMLDISWDDAKKMTMIANESLNSEDVLSSIVVSGKDYFNFRKDKIKFMTTGVEELDEITGGFETGVITEFFGAFGSGKTQFMMVACIMAQLPEEKCCLSCGQTDEEKIKSDKCECGGTWWKGGGLSHFGKQSKVIYIDTENSYRPERLFEIVCNRELIKTKPQTKTQEKKCETKEPLDDEEYEKAMQFVYNIHISRPRTSALQMLVVANLSSMISGELCKHCQKREITKDSEPTHQNHPQATLVVLDSITGKFRKEFEGRGTLSDRQVKLSSHVRLLESVVESKNIICLVTNQAQEALGVMGDNIRPVGGNVIGHTFTHRIYLKKPQSMSKDKITAILVDSPNKAKNEVVLELGSKGIQEPTV